MDPILFILIVLLVLICTGAYWRNAYEPNLVTVLIVVLIIILLFGAPVGYHYWHGSWSW